MVPRTTSGRQGSSACGWAEPASALPLWKRNKPTADKTGKDNHLCQRGSLERNLRVLRASSPLEGSSQNVLGSWFCSWSWRKTRPSASCPSRKASSSASSTSSSPSSSAASGTLTMTGSSSSSSDFSPSNGFMLRGSWSSGDEVDPFSGVDSEICQICFANWWHGCKRSKIHLTNIRFHSIRCWGRCSSSSYPVW